MTRTNIQGDVISAINALGHAAHQWRQVEAIGGAREQIKTQAHHINKHVTEKRNEQNIQILQAIQNLQRNPQQTITQEIWKNENNIRENLAFETLNTINTQDAVEACKASFVNPREDLSE